MPTKPNKLQKTTAKAPKPVQMPGPKPVSKADTQPGVTYVYRKDAFKKVKLA
jgi:hypothetical protein